MIVSHLYKITNKITNEYYIGKHNGWKQNGYWGSGIKIERQVKKYGKENFEYQILVYGTPEYILELEQKMVTLQLIESDEKCLNLIPGGKGALKGYKHSDETRKLISEKIKQIFKERPEIYYDSYEKQKGKKFSEESRKKISLAVTGEKNGFYGKKHSEEIIEKIRQKITGNKYWLGKKHKKETKDKLREARAKQVMPKESYEKSSKTMSSLIWMNDGTRSYRVRPENIQASKEKGMIEGRITSYIDDKYKDKFKSLTKNQWKKVKETGHTGPLIKVN